MKKSKNKVDAPVIIASALVTTAGMGTIKLASLALKAVVTILVSL